MSLAETIARRRAKQIKAFDRAFWNFVPDEPSFGAAYWVVSIHPLVSMLGCWGWCDGGARRPWNCPTGHTWNGGALIVEKLG